MGGARNKYPKKGKNSYSSYYYYYSSYYSSYYYPSYYSSYYSYYSSYYYYNYYSSYYNYNSRGRFNIRHGRNSAIGAVGISIIVFSCLLGVVGTGVMFWC